MSREFFGLLDEGSIHFSTDTGVPCVTRNITHTLRWFSKPIFSQARVAHATKMLALEDLVVILCFHRPPLNGCVLFIPVVEKIRLEKRQPSKTREAIAIIFCFGKKASSYR